MRCVSLCDLGYPHYDLYEDGRLHNLITDVYRIPQKGNEYVLWNASGTHKQRVNSKHLLSWCFESPEALPICRYMSMAILGFSDYLMTENGDVYSLKTFHYLVHSLSVDGYHRVCVRNDNGVSVTLPIGRTVAKLFIPNPDNKPEVNHIDGNKNNNHVDNLEWVYGWENVHHACTHGLRKSVMTDELIHLVCQRLEAGCRVVDIMNEFQLPKHAILDIKSGVHNRISQLYSIPRNKHF